ncbi:NADP-dependent oxidoreductase [Iodobacter fluviatilis]|uniref:NADPH:quinone reductase-like Zn-dependent oxidoreductase n=1 Tax=Iodobacter fluviatilis TaxID=537 RepID=A0A377Q358_9NEIS|nr:NADP-dependent oxidoreductase [Iodobacter fluviatilis]TCU90133.1 NADPH:quinone reductase-like Zn-dependent oxidoreductase [Iodobacter fluviatilis]STQ89160.1 Zinc-type alcohol dehydrogenase-like protein SA1988 [Iodobacter fluviatilis]
MKASMQAIRQHRYGQRDVLQLENVPTPQIAADDVLIKVYAAGVNPVDWKIREGYLQSMLAYEMPLTLGWDVAGEIVALGEQVTGWQIGDAVYSRPDIARNGAYAEFVAVRASEIAKKPKSLDWQQAAAVPLAALTAWQALFAMGQLQAGEKVLIHAGAGGVGLFAIQLAKWRGAEVYTTTSGKNTELVTAHGADHVIDYTQTNFADLRDLDLVFDTMGGDILAQSWQTLKAGGRLVSICDQPDEATAHKHHVNAHFCFVQPNAAQLSEIATLLDAGHIKVVIDSVFPFAQAALAHERSESGRARGKIVLQVI